MCSGFSWCSYFVIKSSAQKDQELLGRNKRTRMYSRYSSGGERMNARSVFGAASELTQHRAS